MVRHPARKRTNHECHQVDPTIQEPFGPKLWETPTLLLNRANIPKLSLPIFRVLQVPKQHPEPGLGSGDGGGRKDLLPGRCCRQLRRSGSGEAEKAQASRELGR